jgi:hypothetical protein
MIPKETPVVELLVWRQNGGSNGCGVYLCRKGRWFLIQNLDTIPDILDRMK